MAKKTAKKSAENKALILHEIALSTRAEGIIKAETPKGLIKTKPGRGGKSVTYVEGGYVVAQLNAAFSPLGWEFKITERGESPRKTESKAEGEVWVYGELTIVDHKNGFRVTKGQYGQHPIHQNVPIGDAFKAAATDALKKCASLLGIALDVYWGQLDAAPSGKPNKKEQMADLFERAKIMVKSSKNIDSLTYYQEKLATEKGELTPAQVKEMIELVKARIKELQEA